MISVVVPFYNEEAHIETCLVALLNQSAPKETYELIFVDNNSTDRSAEIVRRHAGVTLLREAEQGDYAARNRGIREAEGSVVAFTDADTAPDGDWIARVATTMQENLELQLLVGSLQFDGHGPVLRLLQAYEFEKTDYVFGSDCDEILFAYTSNLAVRKRFLVENGLFQAFRRNADMFLLKTVLEVSGRRAVRFEKEMRALRLEITGFRDYLGKMLLYGEDAHVYGSASGFRPLNLRERSRVMKRTIRGNRLSPPQSLLLVAALVVGGITYEGARRLLRRHLPMAGTDNP